MHMPSSTALPVTLLGLLLSSSSSMASSILDRSICVRPNALILAEAAACGSQDSLRECFQAVPDFVTLDDLQSCFVEAGCTIAEAASEAAVILQNCDASVSVPELRRRGPEATPETSPTPTPTPTPTPNDNNNSSGSITTSGIVVTILLALVVVIVVTTLLFFYAKDRKARALAREKEEEEKRKQDQEASEAALRKFAQTQMARERARRQQIEAREWAQRRAGMENPRLPENPFDDRRVP